jgi:hypothetical protein
MWLMSDFESLLFIALVVVMVAVTLLACGALRASIWNQVCARAWPCHRHRPLG